jgi:hypothetical protein
MNKMRTAITLALAAGILGGAQGNDARGQRVEDYSVFFAACSTAGSDRPCVCLRSFRQGGVLFLLCLDPSRLTTRIVRRDDACFAPATLPQLRDRFRGLPYFVALDSMEKSGRRLQDAGITHVYPAKKGIDLTADLCPSKRPLDREFFTTLISRFEPEEKPVPIGVAVTGNWMWEHADDLAWLVGLQKKGDLNITWINHSYNHRTIKGAGIAENFLLEKGTDLNFEVLNTERKMIENGMTPSVFFRFPGLVSDSLIFVKIVSFGLIPLGSDAWLAKNQLPADGSIVLVHANGNEPYGIKRFFDLIRQERDSIITGRWLLFDLRQSVAESEKEK